MKLTNLIIVIALVALCVLGWGTLASGNASKEAEYESYIAQAEDCLNRRLYQRAIENYLSALGGRADEEIYIDIADAYSLRYEEAPEETFSDYLSFLKTALGTFPGSQTLVDHMVSLCLEDEDYRTLYPYLKKAVASGCDGEPMLALYARARYDYSLRGNTFQAIVDSGTGIYTVLTNRGWNMYTMSNGYQLTDDWVYVGPDGSGVTVITGEDSRIVHISDSMVLGIFPSVVTAAGIFGEGLIPVQIAGGEYGYGYYNDYADYQFGSYGYAGTFQNGLAAVEEDGRWMLVNPEGGVERDGFERIVTDLAGRYLVDGTILVRESGAYVMYDSKWKRQAELSCDEVDILSEDGMIAFRSGGKWGFADMDGNIVIEPAFANARSFSNGLAAVQNSDGLWGFVDRTGRLVIDYTFTGAGYLSSEGACPVRVDEPLTAPVYDSKTGAEITIPEQWRLLSLTNGITKD